MILGFKGFSNIFVNLCLVLRLEPFKGECVTLSYSSAFSGQSAFWWWSVGCSNFQQY